MLAFIVSDNQAAAENLRRVLIEQHVDCGVANIVTSDRALTDRVSEAAELVFVVLSAEIDRALGLISGLRKSTRSKLIAVGSARDPQQILQVVQAGSDGYVDEDGNLADQVKAAIERAECDVRVDAPMGQIITVTAANGGTGRSTISANLAFALAEYGSCCLVDLDLRRGDLAAMVNAKPQHTIVDICAHAQRLDEQMFRESLCDCGHGVHLLAAPQRLDDVQQVTTAGVEQIMEYARTSFEFVVVDLEDFFHREQFRVLQLSNSILFPFRLNFSGLRNTRRTLEYLRRAGIDDQNVHLVANQAGRAKELSTAQAEDALQMKIAYFIPDDPKTQNHALNSGVPAVIDNPRSKLAKAIKQLTSVRAQEAGK